MTNNESKDFFCFVTIRQFYVHSLICIFCTNGTDKMWFARRYDDDNGIVGNVDAYQNKDNPILTNKSTKFCKYEIWFDFANFTFARVRCVLAIWEIRSIIEEVWRFY